MLEKRPPQDTITTFSGVETTFKVDYDDHRWYNIFLSINGGPPLINGPIGGEAFTYSNQFEAGEYTILIVISESDRTSDKADTTRSRRLKEEGVRFEWAVRVIPTNVLYNSEFENAVEIIKNILTLYTLGTLGKQAIELIEKYYDSLSHSEQEELREQTKISEYINGGK